MRVVEIAIFPFVAFATHIVDADVPLVAVEILAEAKLRARQVASQQFQGIQLASGEFEIVILWESLITT